MGIKLKLVLNNMYSVIEIIHILYKDLQCLLRQDLTVSVMLI